MRRRFEPAICFAGTGEWRMAPAGSWRQPILHVRLRLRRHLADSESDEPPTARVSGSPRSVVPGAPPQRADPRDVAPQPVEPTGALGILESFNVATMIEAADAADSDWPEWAQFHVQGIGNLNLTGHRVGPGQCGTDTQAAMRRECRDPLDLGETVGGVGSGGGDWLPVSEADPPPETAVEHGRVEDCAPGWERVGGRKGVLDVVTNGHNYASLSQDIDERTDWTVAGSARFDFTSGISQNYI